MLSAPISVSFYVIRVQRVVMPNACKPQQKYNSNIENSPQNLFYRHLDNYMGIYLILFWLYKGANAC